MTERKKPGPKPKCKECGRKEGEGHYDDCPVGMGVGVQWTTTELKSDGPTIRETVHLNPETHNLNPETHTAQQSAQAYAQRVWDGQSVDVPRAEKLRRVKIALDGQELSMEGVVL